MSWKPGRQLYLCSPRRFPHGAAKCRFSGRCIPCHQPTAGTGFANRYVNRIPFGVGVAVQRYEFANSITRWIEPDPDRFNIGRYTWDLLLQDKFTLGEIAEAVCIRRYGLRTDSFNRRV